MCVCCDCDSASYAGHQRWAVAAGIYKSGQSGYCLNLQNATWAACSGWWATGAARRTVRWQPRRARSASALWRRRVPCVADVGGVRVQIGSSWRQTSSSPRECVLSGSASHRRIRPGCRRCRVWSYGHEIGLKNVKGLLLERRIKKTHEWNVYMK